MRIDRAEAVPRFAALALFLQFGLASGVAQEPPRPNIVVLLSDDMGWKQVGFNGGEEVSTPHIDSIARDGLKLTQFYVQPVCTPTRGCLMTGRYAWKNGTEVRPTATSQHGMLRDERTLAEALREAGATWMVGKWHLGEWQSIHLPLAARGGSRTVKQEVINLFYGNGTA